MRIFLSKTQMVFFQHKVFLSMYTNSHYKDHMAIRPFDLYKGNCYAGNNLQNDTAVILSAKTVIFMSDFLTETVYICDT